MSDPARPALRALLFGNFVIGTGVLLPAGMLNTLSADLGVTVPAAGLLMFIGGLVVGFGAPVFAALTSGIDRRHLLAACLALYVAGHAASAFAPGFAALAALRALTIVAAAVFTPQAAATVGLLVPPERRGAAIAMIFIGWSVASVAGIPAAGLIADHLGWRTSYAVTAFLSALALAGVWRTMKPGLKVQPLSFAAWKDALANPAILCVLAVTLASASGQFTLFTYLAPVLKSSVAASPAMISAYFAACGVAGVFGNWLATRHITALGIDRGVLAAILAMTLGLALFGLAFGSMAGLAAGGVIGGLGTFAANSLQQSRLAALAPPLASASIALNTSVMYLGQSNGAWLGGRLIAGGATPLIAFTAAGLLALAAGLSVLAGRLGR